MKLFKSLATTLVVGAMSTASVFAFDCVGNTQCNFQINNDTPQSCIEAIEVFTGPLNGTGSVQIAYVNYKTLAGTCFTMTTGGHPGTVQLIQTNTGSGYQFEYSAPSAQVTVPGYSGTFYSTNGLHLRSNSLYPNPLGQNNGAIAYTVTADVELVNGANTMTLFEGSSVLISTKKPKVICKLQSSECYLQIDGTDYVINPEITIESEEPSDDDGTGIRIGIVTAKELIDDLGLELVLDFGRPADESYFALEQIDPDNQYPANVKGHFAVQINYEDEVFVSDQVLSVESTNPVENWPPEAGNVEYVISEPIQFISESGREIVIHEGVIRN